MKIRLLNSSVAGTRAFSFVEILVAVAVIGTAVTSLYLSISSGFRVIEAARENLRATQIMVERLETIRLHKWTEATNSAFVGTSFQEYYNHVDTNGFVFSGTISIAPVSTSETYASDMREMTIGLTWTSGGITRNRTMQTLIAKHGIQNYVY